MKPYPKYRDTGVEWIGEIPSDWKISPLRRYLSKIGSGVTPKGGAEVYQDSGVPLLRSQNVHFGGLRLDDVAFISDAIHKDMQSTEVNPNDVLINITGASIGRCCVVPDSISRANVNQHVCILRCDDSIKPRLLNYFLMSEVGQTQVWLGQTGAAREGLTYGEIGRFVMILPPSPEQQSIIHFLNTKTTHIDELIKRKRRQIELLKEYRASVISEAVTKGLNPNVRMKDSGVEWLGEIPDHWRLKRLKWVGDAIIGLTYSPDDVVGDSEGTLVLRASNIQKGQIVLNDNVFVSSDIPFELCTRIGDIIICTRNGSRNLVGKTGRISEKEAGLTFGAFTAVFRSTANDYLFYVFNSGLFSFQAGLFQTSTIFQLTNSAINNFQIPLPGDDEQHAIAEFLKQKTDDIDRVVEATESSIDQLHSYRMSLISEAVTGKIDVRDWAKTG